jgi:hypothetical protein
LIAILSVKTGIPPAALEDADPIMLATIADVAGGGGGGVPHGG